MQIPKFINTENPVLIAGATASGKSSLALAIAQRWGGQIVNADALQVYGRWPILTAQPSKQEQAQVRHQLYGYMGDDQPYSTGHWLRAITPLVHSAPRAIIVGGTGLYFQALTQGLSPIPQIPSHIRHRADKIAAQEGLAPLLALLDQQTKDSIDCQNPMRVKRAWEVQTATGRSIKEWQDKTPAPLLPLENCHALYLNAPRDWLNARIEKRFDQMLKQGALKEAQLNMPNWNSNHPSSKAIGAAELIAHLRGEIPLHEAREKIIIATRQYAKRQRTWFRKRMKDWQMIDPSATQAG